jgi:hypothetical protein
MPVELAAMFGDLQVADRDESIITLVEAMTIPEMNPALCLPLHTADFDNVVEIVRKISTDFRAEGIALAVVLLHKEGIGGDYRTVRETAFLNGIQGYERVCADCEFRDGEPCEIPQAIAFCMVAAYEQYEQNEAHLSVEDILDILDNIQLL